MSTVISKGRLFRATFTISDDFFNAMKRAPDIAVESVRVGALYWHSKILPKHFQTDAHDKYGYADRTSAYRKTKSYLGAPDLVFSGRMKQELTSRAEFKDANDSVELKMYARALNFAPPMPANSADLYVPSAGKTQRAGYPNMKREIRIITDDEREAVAAVVTEDCRKRFAPNN